jgi:hypothetical protein
MSAWSELRPILKRLRDQRPHVLLSCPSLQSDTHTPPFRIRLAPWSAGIAEELHRQFGDSVYLTVGLLPYPLDRPPWPHPNPQPKRAPDPPPDLLDPREVTAILDAPATVASGQTLRHHLAVHNLTDAELLIATNGAVTANVVDPRTGEEAGGFAGMQTLALKPFRVSPGDTTLIPLVIGTASSLPRLGYTIPPGEWGIRVTLKLGRDRDAPVRRTPVLPLTVTP